MPATTRVSTTSSRHPTHRSRSYPVRTQANGDETDSVVSDSSDLVKKPDVYDLRRVRAQLYKKSPNERRAGASRKMEPPTPRRSHSDSKAYSREDPKVAVREVREVREVHRRRGSDHRPRHHTSRKEDEEEEEEEERVTYVYKSAGQGRESADHAKPSIVRRSTHGGEAGRSRHERSRMDIREPPRRHSERRSSNYKEQEHAPLRHERRSISENVPRTDRGRAPVTRSTSVRETRSASIFRPSLKRSQSSARKDGLSSYVPPATPDVREKVERAPSSIGGSRRGERSSGIFGSIFGTSRPPRPLRPLRPPRPLEPEKQVECLTCLSDVPITKSAKLACSHRMCHFCLKRIFTLSVTDPQHMPPKCCTADHIPLRHVEKLFDVRFKTKWNKKYQEYTTKNRIYCPSRGCGEWIKPSQIHVDASGGANGGRKYGKCGRCKTKVCCTCNGKWHTGRECPKDPATQEFIKIAKEEGWQRCFNCKATVELKEGCNHMTCRCRAEFCMICGLKWKTCDCPWFNYEAVEADRLNHMNVPFARRVPVVNPARGYQEELDRRRQQELRDEAFARRIQVLGLGGEPEDFDDEAAFGNAAGHFMNHDFVRRAADILSAAYNPAQNNAAERIIAEVHRDPQPQRQQPIPPPPPPLRQHSTASRQYNNHPNIRASERVIPRRQTTGYVSEAARHRPAPLLRAGTGERAVAGDARSASTLAGMNRGQTAVDRVSEWARHVEPVV